MAKFGTGKHSCAVRLRYTEIRYLMSLIQKANDGRYPVLMKRLTKAVKTQYGEFPRMAITAHGLKQFNKTYPDLRQLWKQQ